MGEHKLQPARRQELQERSEQVSSNPELCDLGKLLALSKPQLAYLQSRTNYNTYLLGL